MLYMHTCNAGCKTGPVVWLGVVWGIGHAKYKVTLCSELVDRYFNSGAHEGVG